MIPKTPAFWYDKGLAGRCAGFLLFPFSILYLAGHAFNQITRKAYRPGIPVICIGNLTVGGSGKTPAAIAVMDLIVKMKLAKNPCFLSRGYGGSLKGPVFVDGDHHSFEEVGDEPLLLARHAPAIISADRKTGALLALERGHDLIVMDDGLQNPSIEKTLSLTVIDGNAGLGNGFILPAGPMREPAFTGFNKSDAFIVAGEDRRGIEKKLPGGKAVLRARIAVPTTWMANKNSAYIAFCGLGQPEKFRRTVEENGLNLAGWHAFPDHHRYTPEELRKLDSEALQKKARLLTTEKDSVRLPPGFSFKSPLDILPVKIEWENEDALCNLLKTAIS